MKTKDQLSKQFRIVERLGMFRVERNEGLSWVAVKGSTLHTRTADDGAIECYTIDSARRLLDRCVEKLFEDQHSWSVVS